MKLATAAQMQEMDRQAIEERRIPSLDLMEQAAEALVKSIKVHVRQKISRCRISVFCGTGNNGGDGIAAARLLFLAGAELRVFLVGDYEKLKADPLEMTAKLSECGLELEPFDPEDAEQLSWVLGSHAVIDAIFGVGLSRPIAEDSLAAAAIRRINRCPGLVVAADVASGISADTGEVLGCAVKADRTVTFTLKKIGQTVGEGENTAVRQKLCPSVSLRIWCAPCRDTAKVWKKTSSGRRCLPDRGTDTRVPSVRCL